MIIMRLKIGLLDRRTQEFEERDAYDMEAHESVNGFLEADKNDLDSVLDHAILELVFPMGEVQVATFSKRQTTTKKGKKKIRWCVD